MTTLAPAPKRTHLELSSGVYLDVANPLTENVLPSDISLSLSNTCRWAGHCFPRYSVAEHACLVHDILKAWGCGPYLCRAGLHHDDHEVFIGDIPTPVKNLLDNAAPGVLRAIADRLDRAIAPVFKLRAEDLVHPLIKKADTLALFVEAAAFKPSGGLHWEGRPEVVELPAGVPFLNYWPPVAARLQYEARDA